MFSQYTCALCGVALDQQDGDEESFRYCSERCASIRARTPMADRFWKLVRFGDGCWLWTGARYRFGYGSVWDRSQPSLKEYAHRVSWKLTYGAIPSGLVIRHFVCDNPPCVRPSHLAIGTQRDNIHDALRSGRMPVGDLHPRHLRPELTRRGERSGTAKLTEVDVAKIRSMVKDGVASQAEIARSYHVRASLISLIVNGKRWAHSFVG